MDTGPYGSTSDGEIFDSTSFNRKLTMGLLDLPAPAKLPEDKDGYLIPFAFVGGETFPLRENLM